jgi:hypothetical protein
MSDFWKDLLLQTIEIFLVVATPIIILLGRKAIKMLEKKLGVDLEEKQEQQLENMLDQGIAYAREKSRSSLKATDKPLSGDDKKALAVEYVTSAIKESGMVERGAETLERRLAAKLNMDRHVADKDIPTRKTK